MSTVKKLMYRVIICFVVLGMVISTQIITPKANPESDPVIDFEHILFLKRERLPGAESEGNHMCDQYFGHNQRRHSSNGLYILKDAFSGNPTVENVLKDSVVQNGRRKGQKLEGGAFISLDLSYDATEILFAYTDAHRGNEVWDYNTVFHIYKVNIDGSGLTQLTDGKWNDFDPVWLPDGDIVFISERRGGFGRCHQRPVPTYTLHRMDADGNNIKTISYHETNEWNPSVDNNGMILYTRWDYVDRGATHPHSAWITTPDGLDPRPVTFNYPIPRPHVASMGDLYGVPLMQMSLKAIPNSNKIVGVGAPHHGQNYGALILIDPDVEDDDHFSSFTNITTRLNGNGFPESGGGNTRFATPYPLSEELFLCVYQAPGSSRYAVSLLDISGGQENITELYRDSNISALSPVPVRERPIPNAIRPSRKPEGSTTVVNENVYGGAAVVEENRPMGRVFVANVYDSLLPFPEGTVIEELRIWQVYPKSSWRATDPRVSYEATQSDWAGRNTRGLLGSVPVEEDGSAYFYMRSGMQVFFQVVDQTGTAVQSMRSGVFIIPGQSFMSCQGCHEPRHSTAGNPDYMPLALRREPSTIEPDALDMQGARPVSFPRLIQPVLDAKCISCHDGATQTPDLRSNAASYNWFRSYVNLRPYVFLFDTHYNGNWDRVYPRTEPGVFGARASSLYTHLKSGHGNLTDEELRRFSIWLDSGIAPFYGEYNNLAAQRAGEQVEPIYD